MSIKAQEVIQLILSNIEKGNNQAVVTNLDRLSSIGKLPRDQAEILLSWFLQRATEKSNEEAAQIIIRKFDLARMEVDPLPAITYIFLNSHLSREVTAFTISCFPEKMPIDFFVDLVNMNDDTVAVKAASVITSYFPSISADDWKLLVSLTDKEDDQDEDEDEDYENPLLRAYFQSKLDEICDCAKRPDWIRSDIAEVAILEVPEHIPSVKEAVDLLLEDMAKQNIAVTDRDEAKRLLISQYAISSAIEKIQMLSHIKEIPMFDDTAIFQEHGPVNTCYTVSLNLIDFSHKCEKYGGCRMFLCTEFETQDENGEPFDFMADDGREISDWFRKYCDTCNKRISQRHHAVRQPLLHGGWKGCYCSLECLREEVDDPFSAVMVGRMQEQLNVIGIRDR
jgi:hypothetical protein